jgi:mannose-6-phosphate isomerase
LVKLLDARQHLSVQVHPPAAVLGAHPTARLKTESWVVMEAEPGAELFLGLVDHVTRDQVRDALGTPDLVRLLRRIPATPGDVFHVPAGLVHALGAGVVVAEVQTPSDTTWRLYDWTAEYDRGPRPLHLAQGWDAIAASWATNTGPIRPRTGAPRLLSTSHYTVDRHRIEARAKVPPMPDEDGKRPRILQVLDGVLSAADGRLGRGEVVVLPADDVAPPVPAVEATTVLVIAPTVPPAERVTR